MVPCRRFNFLILNLRQGTVDAEIKDPLVGVQGYQSFLLSKHVVGQNIAFHAAPADSVSSSNYNVPSFCLPDSFKFILPKLLQSLTVECVRNSESEFHLW